MAWLVFILLEDFQFMYKRIPFFTIFFTYIPFLWTCTIKINIFLILFFKILNFHKKRVLNSQEKNVLVSFAHSEI